MSTICCGCGVQTLKLLILLFLYLFDIILTLVLFVYCILIRAPYYYIKLNCFSNKIIKEKELKTIVIIGYSFAGFEIHKLLQNDSSLQHYRFIIIEPKTFFEFTPSILRTLVSPSTYKSISFPLIDCFDCKHSSLIQGRAISINSKSVIIQLINDNLKCEKKKEINFDYCIICCGSKYSSPIKVNCNPIISDNIYYKNRVKTFPKIYNQLSSTSLSSIAIIGGGPVGFELCAEICEQFPNKLITIIDRNSALCRLFPSKTQKYLTKWINLHSNIILKLNTRITEIIVPNNFIKQENKQIISQFMDITQTTINSQNNKYKLKLKNINNLNFELLEFDIIFRCAGFQPNSEVLQSAKSDINFQMCLQNKYKFIEVDEWMKISHNNNNNVFAIGDVINQPKIAEIKLAHTTEIHARYLHDLLRYESTSTSTKSFIPYHIWLLGDKITSKIYDNSLIKNQNKKWKMPLIFTISLGSVDGAMGFGNFILNGCISQIFKWFIQWSLCKLYPRKGLYDIKLSFLFNKDFIIFRIYPFGYRISELLWYLNHHFTLWYIRRFNDYK